MTARLFPDPFPPACASAWGDDRYGLWCEITVKGVVQRLRWIEPGTFLMGSTYDERERFAVDDESRLNLFSDEAPRHRVLLTQGFWLADTACTQALWHAVAGDRPGKFKGVPDLPVEQVSWDDVTTKFMPEVRQWLAESDVFLPTEAQWEYACRAGSKSAYNLGETIREFQVNMAGNCTVPVKALPANHWGLFQMHGNVWEWCADARRSYTAESTADPDGGQEGSVRALRGGSWHSETWRVRCAFRLDRHRDSRDGRSARVGFRFALKSIKPSR